MQRSQLSADPSGVFVHDAVLRAAQRFAQNTAIVDTSCGRRITYAEYAQLVRDAARGFVLAGLKPGDVIAIYLFNSWEFAVAYHAATLAGCVPTLLNPSYREREVRYQLGNCDAEALVTDGASVHGIDLSGLPHLRHVFCTRATAQNASAFSDLLQRTDVALPEPAASAEETLAALPYSSGTTGLPKGVMLTHSNLVANVYQYLAPGELLTTDEHDVTLAFLPLYHIYGLNVILNPTMMAGGTVVLMPRFHAEDVGRVCAEEAVTYLPLVPPAMNALCAAAERGQFPAAHKVRGAKSGAAPLAPELARRFSELTGIRVRQGYGMTEASPVTHLGFIEDAHYRPDTIGKLVAQTEARIVDETGNDVAEEETGELLMRGPQFMRGYWRAPEATGEALRDGWYWSGDIARCDADGFYQIVDRRKELIKFKGFAVAPAEIEAVLLEHPAVRDCGVVGKPDHAAGEVPLAFIVLREDAPRTNGKLESELCGYVAERLTSYKQPREVRFVSSIPRNPSGKILRKDLRAQL